MNNIVVYELQVSGKYMDFHEENGNYIATKSNWDEGVHNYEEIFFEFDSEKGEFYEKD